MSSSSVARASLSDSELLEVWRAKGNQRHTPAKSLLPTSGAERIRNWELIDSQPIMLMRYDPLTTILGGLGRTGTTGGRETGAVDRPEGNQYIHERAFRHTIAVVVDCWTLSEEPLH